MPPMVDEVMSCPLQLSQDAFALIGSQSRAVLEHVQLSEMLKHRLLDWCIQQAV